MADVAALARADRSPSPAARSGPTRARRLSRNRAAVASMVVLALIALACIFGPLLTGHPYDRVYQDYVRVAAEPRGLSAAPSRSRRRSSASPRACAPRPRTIAVEGDTAAPDARQHRAPIDERLLAYLRALRPVRRRAASSSAQDDGRRLVVEVPIKRQHFLFGTDANGRDLLTRTLIAGRVSLAIGLLATVVAHRHRRALRRDRRLSRRPRRPRHDARRRHALLAALHLLRHHAGRLLRPELRPDVHRRRRGRMARHGAHRPRPDALDQAAGIRAGGRGARRHDAAASCAATSSRTRSARWSST